jgi:hypothetical protein
MQFSVRQLTSCIELGYYAVNPDRYITDLYTRKVKLATVDENPDLWAPVRKYTGPCLANPQHYITVIDPLRTLMSNDKEEIKRYLAHNIPVITLIYPIQTRIGDPRRKQMESNYLHYDLRSNEVPNHAVVIIGWDEKLHGAEGGVWYVQNSWGNMHPDDPIATILRGKAGLGHKWNRRWVIGGIRLSPELQEHNGRVENRADAKTLKPGSASKF